MDNKLAIRKTGIEIQRNKTLDALVKSGGLVHILTDDVEYTKPLSAALIDLPDGKKGIICSVQRPSQYYASDSISIRTLDGEVMGYITEPELNTKSVEPRIVKDGDFLYVVTCNTRKSFLAKYSLKDFSRIWKNNQKDPKLSLEDPVLGRRYGLGFVESMEVTNDYVVVFDRNKNSLEFFDKETGKLVKMQDLGTHVSDHELASIDGKLINSSSGANIPNIVEIYDESGENLLYKKEVDTNTGKIEGLAVDKENNRIYLAVDNVMVVYEAQGCLGAFEIPDCSKIMGIDVDQDSGSVLISNYDQENPENTGTRILSKVAIEQLLELYRPPGRYLPVGKPELKEKKD